MLLASAILSFTRLRILVNFHSHFFGFAGADVDWLISSRSICSWLGRVARSMLHVDVERTAIGLSSLSACFIFFAVAFYTLTFLPLNVSMTLSAPAFSTKLISAMTVGFAATSLQEFIGPPTPNITCSISAAVVPGAKFCAITMYGPDAMPFMLSSGAPFAESSLALPLLLSKPPRSGADDCVCDSRGRRVSSAGGLVW